MLYPVKPCYGKGHQRAGQIDQNNEMKTGTPKNTERNFQINLRTLKRLFRVSSKEIARRSGISERMVDYLLAGERSPTEETANSVGMVFGVNGWMMLYPNLTADLIKRGRLEKLIAAYGLASDEGKDLIEKIAEREAKYST